ncbi:hypothetical protein [Adhaeribacter soli]|uniref:Lipoprotein n=1 Tax=Adhaeribacter soli TaxID=2607655 RepID=A0A5N1J506_9BACT|nr:hypothetical protein [Adhaeribacter soli]KAA9340894.1 hypothetical protein F0P94_05540 [Adhaeribacter soli]
MKKLFLIIFGAAAFTFQSCIGKDSTADKDNVIDDGMETSENTLGTGSTRPSDVHGEQARKPLKSSTTEGFDTVNTEMGKKPIETGITPGNEKER